MLRKCWLMVRYYTFIVLILMQCPLYGRVELLKADILSETPRVLHSDNTDITMLLLITFDF